LVFQFPQLAVLIKERITPLVSVCDLNTTTPLSDLKLKIASASNLVNLSEEVNLYVEPIYRIPAQADTAAYYRAAGFNVNSTFGCQRERPW
jgi:hypothetical protein